LSEKSSIKPKGQSRFRQQVGKETFLNGQLGKYIRRRREQTKISQNKLAQNLGVSAQFYGQIEKGRVACPRTTLISMIPILKLRQSPVRRIFLSATEKEIRELFSDSK